MGTCWRAYRSGVGPGTEDPPHFLTSICKLNFEPGCPDGVGKDRPPCYTSFENGAIQFNAVKGGSQVIPPYCVFRCTKMSAFGSLPVYSVAQRDPLPERDTLVPGG